MPEENIGRYKIIEEIGRGGMATVYHAYDPRFERDVAIKVLSHAFLHDPQFRARLDREAKTIGTLEHASITPVYDFGEQNAQPYIVMRLMSGGDLSDKLKKGAVHGLISDTKIAQAHPQRIQHLRLWSGRPTPGGAFVQVLQRHTNTKHNTKMQSAKQRKNIETT